MNDVQTIGPELAAARAAAIAADDAFAASVGLVLARVLQLPRIACGPERGRYRTSWGTKTPAGLARSVLRLIEAGDPDGAKDALPHQFSTVAGSL